MKESDNVLVHQEWLTVHEVYDDGTARCGNGTSSGGINYLPMTRGQARAMARSKPCQSLACTAARRSNSICRPAQSTSHPLFPRRHLKGDKRRDEFSSRPSRPVFGHT